MFPVIPSVDFTDMCQVRRPPLRLIRSLSRALRVAQGKISRLSPDYVQVNTKRKGRATVCASQNKWLHITHVNMYVYTNIGFKTFFYVVRHLDSTASYLPTGLQLGYFIHGCLYSFHPVFLRSSSCFSFVLAFTSMLFWAIFLLPFFEHGRTMWAGSTKKYFLTRQMFSLERHCSLNV